MIEPSRSAADDMVKSLLDGSADGLLLVDAGGQILLANQSAAMMFGYDEVEGENELVGRQVDDLVPEEYRAGHARHRQSFAADPRRRPMGTNLQLFAQHRSGDLFPVEISLSPTVIDGVPQSVATVRDVSERQESRARILLHEERARIANDLHDLVIQRLFAAGMSLQSVMNLIESPVARDRIDAVTSDIDETVRAVRSAIFSMTTHDEAQSLSSHISSLVAERSRHLGFTPDLSIDGGIDDVPEFIGDQLVAALIEAISNVARHANATDASIRVSRSASGVRLIVRDNGGGVASDPKPMGGLSGVMWRAAELGGSCSVSPVEPSGTELSWHVPV